MRSPIARIALVVCLTMFVAAPALAQSAPKGDFAASYSILNDRDLQETFPVGWVVAVAGNVTRMFAIVGEVGGNYKTISEFGSDVKLKVHSFMGGVRVGGEAGTAVRPFAQFLVGAARGDTSMFGETAGSTELALQPGAGVDFMVTPRFGVRGQVDYRAIRASGTTSSEVRVAFGVVIPFGG